jgi:hypothetical protein
MVSVDFTSYYDLYDCPAWWRNFILYILRESGNRVTGITHFEISCAMEKFRGVITDNKKTGEIDAIEFETDEDLNTFKIYWTLYGS